MDEVKANAEDSPVLAAEEQPTKDEEVNFLNLILYTLHSSEIVSFGLVSKFNFKFIVSKTADMRGRG